MHSRSWFRRSLCAFSVWIACLPAFFVPRYLLKTEHNPPVGVYIAVMGLAAAVVTFREKIRPSEKAAWIVLVTLLVFAEITNLYVADADQLAKFTKVSDALDATKKGLNATVAGIDVTVSKLDVAAAHSLVYFDRTTGQITSVSQALSRFQEEEQRTAERLARAPLSNMPWADLAATAHSIGNEMRYYLRIYTARDSELAVRYHEHLIVTQGRPLTPKEAANWIAEEKQKRSELQATYEADVLELIAVANRVRGEMLGRLVPSNRQPDDDLKKAWFENPRSDKSLSFLYKLNENADYLEQLAQRMPHL